MQELDSVDRVPVLRISIIREVWVHMRYLPMEQVQPGMRLAQAIWDSSGRILVGQNHDLTAHYIEKLKLYGFDGLYIEDELSEGIQIEPVISPALRAEGLMHVRDRNVDGCKRVAKLIVEEILAKGEVSLDLTDLRTYDDYTYAHSVNVAVISCVIGIGFRMMDDELVQLVTAALLHDLGKLSIPQEILNKPGRLSQEEYQVMKSHAALSYEYIRDRWDISAHIKGAVLFHHENVDGSGYPQGLTGEEQSLFIKILHVSDVYDALVSKRPYKDPYSPHEASEYLMGGCGTMFEQEVVEVLLRYVPLYPKGSEVILSDERRGIVYENAGFHNIRPIIRLFTGEMLDLSEPEYMSLTLRTLQEVKNAPEQYEAGRQEMIRPWIRYRILAVDDMKTNLQLLQEILGPLYEMILVKSGRQALTYIEKNGMPDLILMDIDMPEMDGIETARRIRERGDGDVPILFVSALGDRETVMRTRQVKANGYIIRPYKPVFIRSEIKKILTGRSDSE